jgi:glycosyltransferase involved in cell wall biosynthesis
LAKSKPDVIIEQVSLPKVSIIIPTYNRRDFLEQALESVLAQDYENLEIVVSDNASTDGTQDMMEDFIMDIRIKYHRHTENIGAAANHQYALYHLATGKYALILSDDDYLIDNSYISKAIELIRKNPSLVLVHANCKMHNVATNEVTVTHHKSPLVVNGIDYFVNYEQEGYDHIVAWMTSLFNREKAMQAGCLKEKSLAGDILLYLKLMLTGDVGVIKDCVAVYRFHEGSGTNHLDLEQDLETIKELEKIKDTALKLGLPLNVMNEWIKLRVFKYVRWCCISYFSNDKQDIGWSLLNSIKDKYPESNQAVKDSLGF